MLLKNLHSKKNITNFAIQLRNTEHMKRKLVTEKEWDLIAALRNYRKSYHNQSIHIELYIDQLVDELKEKED